MWRSILKFGVISGLVSGALMLAYVPFMHHISLTMGAVFGYSGMLIAFLFVYFGVRSFRDREQAGTITFTRAFAVGLGITVISCLFYVGTWEFVYFNYMPDFAQQYAAAAVQKARDAGQSEQQVAALQQQMDEFRADYAKPLYNFAMTFAEPLPVGLLVTVVSALTLRRRPTRPA